MLSTRTVQGGGNGGTGAEEHVNRRDAMVASAPAATSETRVGPRLVGGPRRSPTKRLSGSHAPSAYCSLGAGTRDVGGV